MGVLPIFQSKFVLFDRSDETRAVCRGKRFILLNGLACNRYRCDRVSFLDGLTGEVDEQMIDAASIARADRAYCGFRLRDSPNRGNFLGKGFAAEFGGLNADFLLFFRRKLNSGSACVLR